MYFPDRKSQVNTLLLFGLASGIATYSGLTAYWAYGCVPPYSDLSVVLQNLAYCMFGQSLVASLLLTSPSFQLNSNDMRQLHYNLLNVQHRPGMTE